MIIRENRIKLQIKMRRAAKAKEPVYFESKLSEQEMTERRLSLPPKEYVDMIFNFFEKLGKEPKEKSVYFKKYGEYLDKASDNNWLHPEFIEKRRQQLKAAKK